MSKQREIHREELRQLLVRHGVGDLWQASGRPVDLELLIDEVLRLGDRLSRNHSLDEALNSGDGTYRP